jgi:dGTPase
MSAAESVVADLFAAYTADATRMPQGWAAAAAAAPDERRRARIVADFVAGQTDRYAIGEHRRLFDATPDLR